MPDRNEKEKSTRGRKSIFGLRLKSHTITIPENLVSYLKDKGDGNLSEGVRSMASNALQGVLHSQEQ
jgi:hypothetical protein